MPRPRKTNKPPSILDVAAAAGVSHQTVSRVLNDSDKVAPSTRAKVVDAISRLGYRRNSVARALVTRRSGILGIITTTSWHYGPTSILLWVEIAARAAGYYTVVAPVDDDDAGGVATALDHFLALPVEGLVFIAPTRDVTSDLEGVQLPVPIVAVTSAEVGAVAGVIPVAIDQPSGSQEIMDHLLGLGHTDIAHIAGPAVSFEARIRESIWRKALEDRGLPTRALGERGWSSEVGYREGQALAKGTPPTAVFCANDEVALGVYRAFAEAGLRIPEDVSVVGFDDQPQNAHYLPPLTSVAQDFPELGREIVRTLTAAIDSGPVPGVHLPSRLVVRASTAPPRH